MSRQRVGSYAESKYHVEGWRANIPLFRAIATSASILLTAMWFTWQGSQWVASFQASIARIEIRLEAIENSHKDKATIRDLKHELELLCARAPTNQKGWVCRTTP